MPTAQFRLKEAVEAFLTPLSAKPNRTAADQVGDHRNNF